MLYQQKSLELLLFWWKMAKFFLYLCFSDGDAQTTSVSRNHEHISINQSYCFHLNLMTEVAALIFRTRRAYCSKLSGLLAQERFKMLLKLLNHSRKDILIYV